MKVLYGYSVSFGSEDGIIAFLDIWYEGIYQL